MRVLSTEVEALSEPQLSELVRQPGGSLKSRFERLLGTKERKSIIGDS